MPFQRAPCALYPASLFLPAGASPQGAHFGSPFGVQASRPQDEMRRTDVILRGMHPGFLRAEVPTPDQVARAPRASQRNCLSQQAVEKY